MRTSPPIPWLQRACTAALLCAAVALAGCSALSAQNPGSTLKPVNATPAEGANRLMLKGFDVVAYWTQNRHQMGSRQFASSFEGVDFWFASAEHKALFDKEPKKYLPEYGGYCANGIVYGIPWGGDGDSWRMLDGKLYIFGGVGSREGFLLDVPGNIKLANRYWSEEVAGNNSWWQRYKRLVFRVPHYQTGAELAQAVAAAKANGSFKGQ
jgi:YHS domain-containing protein